MNFYPRSLRDHKEIMGHKIRNEHGSALIYCFLFLTWLPKKSMPMPSCCVCVQVLNWAYWTISTTPVWKGISTTVRLREFHVTLDGSKCGYVPLNYISQAPSTGSGSKSSLCMVIYVIYFRHLLEEGTNFAVERGML